MELNKEKIERFTLQLEKAELESNKGEHPSEEAIYMFAKDALPQDEFDDLKGHLDFCWSCGQILAEAEGFREVSREIVSGQLLADYALPDLGKRFDDRVATTPNKAAPADKPVKEGIPQTIKGSLSALQPRLVFNPGWSLAFEPAFRSDSRTKFAVTENGTTEIAFIEGDEEHARIEISSKLGELEGREATVSIDDGLGNVLSIGTYTFERLDETWVTLTCLLDESIREQFPNDYVIRVELSPPACKG